MKVCLKKPLIFESLYLLLVFAPWSNSAPVEDTMAVPAPMLRRTTRTLSGPEMASKMKIGTAVVRGADWSFLWGNQDGGAGSIGHVTGDLEPDKWIRVKWSNGWEFNYRMGADGKYDLKLADEQTA